MTRTLAYERRCELQEACNLAQGLNALKDITKNEHYTFEPPPPTKIKKDLTVKKAWAKK